MTNSSRASHDADVVVVGCGPVGVMAALRCVQRGLSVIAVDRSTEIYPLPRALGMDDEVQDLFVRAGLEHELRAHSTPLRGGEFVDATGRRVVGIELPEGTVGALGHPPMVAFDQPALEAALRAAAVDAGVDMRLALDCYSVADVDGGVQVGLRDEGGEHFLTCRWMIAVDGAKSTVRSLRGLEMVDQGFDQTWLVVDARLLDPSLELPTIAQQRCDPERITTFVPGAGDHRRWEFRLHPGETREDVLDDAVVAELLAPWGTPDQLEIRRTAVYRFHAYVADRFRDGPVFLAGDAAHQMPPFNGQGMCTGIRDSENLAWKLAMVRRGEADDSLLDTYDEERRPHAAAQVLHSVDAGLLIDAIAHDGDAALSSGYGQRAFPRVHGSLFEGDHERVGKPLPAALGPATGLPEGWVVLHPPDLAPSPPALAAVGAAAISMPPDAHPDKLGAVVVRPDRYVAAVTVEPDADLRRIAALAGAHAAPSATSTPGSTS
ncbi:MAG: FAD-dependent monooxygenase [Ilumatobacteraceae bacterium]